MLFRSLHARSQVRTALEGCFYVPLRGLLVRSHASEHRSRKGAAAHRRWLTMGAGFRIATQCEMARCGTREFVNATARDSRDGAPEKLGREVRSVGLGEGPGLVPATTKVCCIVCLRIDPQTPLKQFPGDIPRAVAIASMFRSATLRFAELDTAHARAVQAAAVRELLLV